MNSFISILYIHGFNSAPASEKAQRLLGYCKAHLPHVRLHIPELHHDPAVAIRQLQNIMDEDEGVRLLVGSSLGGYYATWLAQQYRVKAALVNPAVSPHLHLGEEFLGMHTNDYTGRQYELTLAHVDSIRQLDVQEIEHPENFFLLVQTGDETLDYRLAVEKYRHSKQWVEPGGNHSFVDFDKVIPEILAFAGIQ